MSLETEDTYGRASERCSRTRLTAAGNIKASPGKLYWLLISNPDASVRHCTLHDDNDGTDDEIHKFYIAAASTKLFNFDPPIPCSVGIRIGAIEDSDTVITAGFK